MAQVLTFCSSAFFIYLLALKIWECLISSYSSVKRASWKLNHSEHGNKCLFHLLWFRNGSPTFSALTETLPNQMLLVPLPPLSD